MLEGLHKEYNKYQTRIERMYEDKLDGSITEDEYNKKRIEYQAAQRELTGKISKLGIADEEYYLTSEYLLQLANRAYDLFISSEPEEKRQLLKLALQNLRLEGKTVEFELVKPFDQVLACAGSQGWLLG